ncbi:Uncharacterised protein [uncultured archaeon]|nr:Uncharacterised protein [uncultured archaeon]
MATIRVKEIKKEGKTKGVNYYYISTNIKDKKTGKYREKEIYIGNKDKLNQLSKKINELLNS